MRIKDFTRTNINPLPGRSRTEVPVGAPNGCPPRRHDRWAVLILLAIAGADAHAAAPAIPAAPCTGPSAMLGLLDRPTVSDSSCVVPDGMGVLETGFTLGQLSGVAGGSTDTGPNAELRWGLPGNSELVWLPPSFQYQRSNAAPDVSAATARGLGPTTLGIKHEFGYTAHWQWTAEALATLPSGDREFGSPGLGVAANAIVSYSSSGPFGASLMLGVTSETTPSVAGGERYLSINPDFVVTWQSTQRLQFYAEVYGQSHTGHGQGWGSDADGGVQYLITPSFEVDLEEGVRIQGNLGGFSHYTGVGMGLLF